MAKRDIQINPEKAASRVAINAFMIGSLFMILTLIWTLGPNKFNPFIIWQLVLAIPLLFISSLAYAKVSYRMNAHMFDRYGWISHTLGNNMVLNSFGLIAASFFMTLGIVYFLLAILTVSLYYIIDSKQDRSQSKENLLKVILILVIFLVGGIYPLFISI